MLLFVVLSCLFTLFQIDVTTTSTTVVECHNSSTIVVPKKRIIRIVSLLKDHDSATTTTTTIPNEIQQLQRTIARVIFDVDDNDVNINQNRTNNFHLIDSIDFDFELLNKQEQQHHSTNDDDNAAGAKDHTTTNLSTVYEPIRVNYTRTSSEIRYDTVHDETSIIWHGNSLFSSSNNNNNNKNNSNQNNSTNNKHVGYATFIMRMNDDTSFHGTFTTPIATYSIHSLLSRQGKTSSILIYEIVETLLWKDFSFENGIDSKKADDERFLSSAEEEENIWNEIRLEKDKEEEQVNNYNGYYSKDRIVTLQRIGSTNTTNQAIELILSLTSTTTTTTATKPKSRLIQQDQQQTSNKQQSVPSPISSSSAVAAAPSATAPIVYIDVLVLVTNRARCEVAGTTIGCPLNTTNKEPIDNKIEIVETQTNKVFQDMNMNVRIRIVATYYLSANIDLYTNTTQPLAVMENDPSAQVWRNETGADLVTMITGTSSTSTNPGVVSCGIGRQLGYTSATNYQCLDSFSFTVQMGTNFNCYPNRENSTIQHPFAHGYRYENTLRTIMSYDCPIGGCPRYPYFSTPDFTIRILDKNIPLGNSTTDNKRQILATAPIIEQYRETFQTLVPTSTPIIQPPTPDTNSLTCNPNEYPSNTSLGFFFIRNCTRTPNMNLMHRLRLRDYVCMQRCVNESDVVDYMANRNYKCGPCKFRIQKPQS